MSNEQPTRQRSTAPTSPLGSTVAIIVAIAAVIAGFLILRSIREPDSGSVVEETTTTVTTLVTETTAAPTTTEPPLVFTGSLVMVVNATTQNGVAGQMSDNLEAVGFQMAEPTNLADGVEKFETTQVQYNADIPEAKAVADSVARTLGGVEVVPQGLPLDTASGAWPDDQTHVLVMLGADLAGQDLPNTDAPTGENPVTPTDPTVPTTPTT